MAQPGADLFEIIEGEGCIENFPSQQTLQIAAAHVFEDDIVKDCTVEIAGCAMAKTADNIRVANAIESCSLVLEILHERSFKCIVEIVLKEDIQGLDDDVRMRRTRGSQNITGQVDLSVTAPAEPFVKIIPVVEPAVV
jgi:hypothetical protein